MLRYEALRILPAEFADDALALISTEEDTAMIFAIPLLGAAGVCGMVRAGNGVQTLGCFRPSPENLPSGQRCL